MTSMDVTVFRAATGHWTISRFGGYVRALPLFQPLLGQRLSKQVALHAALSRRIASALGCSRDDITVEQVSGDRLERMYRVSGPAIEPLLTKPEPRVYNFQFNRLGIEIVEDGEGEAKVSIGYRGQPLTQFVLHEWRRS